MPVRLNRIENGKVSTALTVERTPGLVRIMKKYLIVIEETGSGYLAYSPDMPGCVANGPTPTEAERNLKSCLTTHLQELRECGEVLPSPHTYPAYVELP